MLDTGKAGIKFVGGIGGGAGSCRVGDGREQGNNEGRERGKLNVIGKRWELVARTWK